MSPNHKYYLVTGDPLLSKVTEYKLLAAKYNQEWEDLEKEFGGTAWGNERGIRGLKFGYGQKIPEGWSLLREYGCSGVYRPTVKIPGGRELQKRMKSIKRPGFTLFEWIVTGDSNPFQFMLTNLAKIPFGYEEIGENFLIAYPSPKNGLEFSGKVWEMPEEGVKLLSEKEYYELKAKNAE